MLTSRRFWQIIFLSLFGLFLLYVGYLVSAVLNPILLALVVAYVLNPIVEWLEDRGGSRFWSVFAVFAVFFTVFILGLVILIPLVTAEAVDLYHFLTSENFRTLVTNVVSDSVEYLNRTFPELDLNLDVIRDRINQFVMQHKFQVANVGKDLGLAVVGAMGHGVSMLWLIGAYLFLLPVFSFYFMLHLDEIWDQVRSWVPPFYMESFDRITSLLHLRISAFFRGQLLVAAVKGIVVLIGLSFLGVPYAFLFGLLGFLGGLVPFLILFLSFLPAVMMLLITQGFTWYGLIGILLVYGTGELLEGTVLYPFLVGKEVNMHPLVVIVCLLVGGELLGFYGVLLSIPLGSAAIILTRELVLPNLRDLLHGDRKTRSGEVESKGEGTTTRSSAESTSNSDPPGEDE